MRTAFNRLSASSMSSSQVAASTVDAEDDEDEDDKGEDVDRAVGSDGVESQDNEDGKRVDIVLAGKAVHELTRGSLGLVSHGSESNQVKSPSDLVIAYVLQ